MIAKEKDKLEALRAIKSALLLEATKGEGEVTEEAEISILQRLLKQRRESAQVYKEQGREDLADPEEFQAGIIEAYMPEQMSEEEVRAEVKKAIEQTGASGPSDMGKVMGPVMGKLKGKADGKMISQIVKEELNN